MSVDCCEGEGSRGYSIDFAILFLHENLRELVIYFDDIGTLPSISKSGSQAYKAFLGLIPKRAPGLRSISLEAYDNEVLERGSLEMQISLKQTLFIHDWETLMQSPMVKMGMHQAKKGDGAAGA